MKLLTGIMAVLLVVLLAFSSLMFYVAERDMDDINAFALVNSALANHLFFDALRRNTINIYVSPRNTPQVFERSGYKIRVIPLGNISHNDAKAELGKTNFFNHNARCVFMHACHIWDDDRDLAVFLLKLLSRVDPVEPNAQILLDEINPDGTVSSSGQDMLEHRQSEYARFFMAYDSSVTGRIEQVGSKAPAQANGSGDTP